MFQYDCFGRPSGLVRARWYLLDLTGSTGRRCDSRRWLVCAPASSACPLHGSVVSLGRHGKGPGEVESADREIMSDDDFMIRVDALLSQWEQCGPEVAWLRGWLATGLAPDEVAPWANRVVFDISGQDHCGFSIEGMRMWVAAGFDADDARRWSSVAVAEVAARWRELGFTADGAEALTRAAGSQVDDAVLLAWAGTGLPAVCVVAACEAGLPVADGRAWKETGLPEDYVVACMRAGVAASEAGDEAWCVSRGVLESLTALRLGPAATVPEDPWAQEHFKAPW